MSKNKFIKLIYNGPIKHKTFFFWEFATPKWSLWIGDEITSNEKSYIFKIFGVISKMFHHYISFFHYEAF